MKLTDTQLYDLRMKVRHVTETELEALAPEMEVTNVFPKKLWVSFVLLRLLTPIWLV